MANKIIHMVLSGVFVFLWFYVGFATYYATDAGGISMGYMLAAVLTLSLGGSSEGGGVPDVYIGAIKSCVNVVIAVAVAFVISRLIYEVALNEDGFQVMGLVHALAIAVASSVLISLSKAGLDNSK